MDVFNVHQFINVLHNEIKNVLKLYKIFLSFQIHQ